MAIAAALLLGVGAYAMTSSTEETPTARQEAKSPAATQAVQPTEEAAAKTEPKPAAAEPAPAPKPAPRAVAPATVAKVPQTPKTIRLITTPPGAEVVDSENAVLGTTPLELAVTGNDRIFSFRLAGFKHLDKVVVSGKKEGDVAFELQTRPAPKPAAKRRMKRRAKKPAAKPAPKPAAKSAPAKAPAKKKRSSARDLF
jgi:hypothetical protein